MTQPGACILDTPVGALAAYDGPHGLALEWLVAAGSRPVLSGRSQAQLALRAAIDAYFRGDANALDPIATPDGTPFERAVWNACRAIPRGEAWSYRRLAERLGRNAGSCRAIAQALRRNPLPVVVPCHRVVGEQGPGGYGGATSGALLRVKLDLLAWEGCVLAPSARDAMKLERVA